MKKVFTQRIFNELVESEERHDDIFSITPEEYLKNMIDCVDENGELDIARDTLRESGEDGFIAFGTAESEEKTTHIEKVKLDVTLTDYDEICAFYKNALNNLKAFIEKHSPECKNNYYCDRMVLYARRINRLIELEAPKFIIENERYMLIDSILLYKTHAVGELIEIKK